MAIDRVVLNASPVIVLFKSELEFILPKLFKEIVIPDSVYKEAMNDMKNDRAVRELPRVDWYETVSVKVDKLLAGWDLGRGEMKC